MMSSVAAAQNITAPPTTAVADDMMWERVDDSRHVVNAPEPAPVLHSCNVILSELTGPANWNTNTGPTGGIVRYSVGTVACNIGLEPLDWYGSTIDHPFMPQNLYRLKNGRFEQVGMGWLKHAFIALQQSFCGMTCQNACGGGACSELGVGCSDPYSPSRNGTPSGLGPRSEINIATGTILTWPYTRPSSQSTTTNNNGQIHVPAADVDPAQNGGAQSYIESPYVVREETEAGNDDNNTSYRRVNISAAQGFPLSFNGNTVQQQPAINAWRAVDPQVNLQNVDIENDGRMILGYRVTDNGNGTGHYEYAVYNMNSDRSGGSFSVPVPGCVTVSNVGFHDVSYHSGEVQDPTDWAVTRSNTALSWATAPYATDVNANALRWATLYNFRFDADAPPQSVEVTLGLFKPGSPDAMYMIASGPQGADAPICPGDVTDDGQVNILDLLEVVAAWGNPGGPGDVSPACGDGIVNIADLLAVVSAWGPCQ